MNFDNLRFCAFLGVFIQHTLPLPEGRLASASITDILISALSFNYLGVPFFFTLSSFLITYRILDEYRIEGKVHLIKFYIKRGLRIWPVYFLLLAVCFIIIPIIYKISGATSPVFPSIWPFLLFWSNFYMISHGVSFIFALIPLWSISIEEQFYFTWGIVLKFFRKFIYLVIGCFFIVSVFYCYYYISVLHQSRTNLKLHSLYAVTDFCTGAFIALTCYEKGRIFRFLKDMPSFILNSTYIAIILFYILQNYQVIQPDLVTSSIFYSVCYALILFDQAFNDKRMFNAGRFNFLNYLGKISYGLYIYHELAVTVVMKYLHFFNPAANFITLLWQAIITLSITIIIAHFSYRYFESFFLRLKKKLGRGN